MELLEKAKRIELISGKLGLIIPVTYLRLEHRDKNGVLYPNGESYNVSRSWVRNAYNHILSRMSGYYPRSANPDWGTGYINYKVNLSGNIISRSSEILRYAYGAGAGDLVNVESTDARGYFRNASSNASGIQVGTGTNAESFEDHSLQTIIAHGTGSGQLSYDAMTRSESDSGLTHKASWSRVLTHNGNDLANITVSEVGLVMALCQEDTVINNYMMLRDVGGDLPKTLVYLDTLTVTYEITLTYPS